MVKPSIKITRIPYEEPHHLNLVVEASSERLRGQIEIYVNANDLLNLADGIADGLEPIPRQNSDVYLWELGNERPENQSAFYFCLRVFTTNSLGRCAILLRFNNNDSLPHREISEFCIQVEPTGLDRLVKLFREFAKLRHEVLWWEPTGGKLYATREEFDLAQE